METITNILLAIITIFNDSAIYILFGFFIAGILYVTLSPRLITKFLGKKDLRSVILAALLGTPLPLCSCSVVPTAISLRKQGASKGSTLAFLISTPETGVDSISLTYALMDPIMTIFRPLSAILTAITAGTVANAIEEHSAPPELPLHNGDSELTEYHGHCSHSQEREYNNSGFTEKFKQLLQYAYGTLLKDLSGWLLISIVIAGMITALIPDTFFEAYLGSGLISMLVMLGVGIPMYMCATASTPLAVALILKGLNPGAALVFLLAGPATNAGTITLVGKFLGRKMLMVYLGTIIFVSLALGTGLNFLYYSLALDPKVTMGTAAELIPFWLKITGSIILLLLIIRQFKGLTPDSLHHNTENKLKDFFGFEVHLNKQLFIKTWKMWSRVIR
ncbi:MAG: SO_0444 family Cu/Zn efflux transporter [Proteobacteria bacterium]|nr:SO_0444 family Cu/Zn efflux transporter [Pseudomonadota bacterium]